MPSIKAVFDNPRTSSRNPETLAKRAGVSAKTAASFLRDQAAAQITKRSHKPPEEDFSPTGGSRGEYLADVIYLRDYAGVNRRRECILTLLGTNSRYVYARALTKATAANTADAMAEILTQNALDASGGVVATITSVRSDGGGEFAGEFAELLQSRGIPLEKGQPGTHARLGRLDRYHGVLRRQLGEMFAIQDSHVWVDSLQELTDNHNTSPSRALNPAGRGLTPATIGPREDEALRLSDLERAATLRQRVDARDIGPGTKVRLLTSKLKKAPKFVKGQEATWTPELYDLVVRVGTNTFLIDVQEGEIKIWPLHSLQVVKKALGQTDQGGPKVDKAVVKAKRLEALNISEEEQAAALSAPAAPKRVPKPTPKMEALLLEQQEKTATSTRPTREKKTPKRYND
jgi:hypothetical protein